jgi:hypothetical protein
LINDLSTYLDLVSQLFIFSGHVEDKIIRFN